MKKIIVCLSLILMIIGITGIASASPFTFEEVFGRDLRVNEGERAIYNFDLTDTGGKSRVKDGSSTVQGPYLPTIDETTFDTNLMVVSALLSFEIGGMDGGNFTPKERIKIKVTGEGGTGETIFNEKVFLGVDTFDFDLTGTWLDWVDDGKLRTVAIAVERRGFVNDFKIRSARLFVEAEPVPEPSTYLLFGSGLLGLIFVRRKFKK